MKQKRMQSKLHIPKYPRWESNPNLRFRKPPFYPLNYKGAPDKQKVALSAKREQWREDTKSFIKSQHPSNILKKRHYISPIESNDTGGTDNGKIQPSLALRRQRFRHKVPIKKLL